MIKNIYVYIILIIILLLIFIGLNIYLNSYYINYNVNYNLNYNLNYKLNYNLNYKKQNNFLKNNTGINEYFYSNFDEIMNQMDNSLFNELDQSANNEDNIDENYLKQNEEINNIGLNNNEKSLTGNNDNIQHAPIISDGNLYSIIHNSRPALTETTIIDQNPSSTQNSASTQNSTSTQNSSSTQNSLSTQNSSSTQNSASTKNSSSRITSSISSSNTCCKEPKPLHKTVCGKHYDTCRVDEEGNDSCCKGYSCLRPMGNFGVKKCLNDSDKGFPYKAPDVDATGYYDLTVIKNDYSKLKLPKLDLPNVSKTLQKINPMNLFNNMFKCKATSINNS
jgi:hypothetical protein